jgi:aspartate/methionine/tyrosine aminotransferase
VLVGSMSKYFSMTGWRVGWLVLPDHLARPIELLLGNLNICAPAISQVAANAALGAAAREELEGHVARYRANRDLVLGRLPELGVTSWAPADGAFYAYADVSHLTTDSQAWCDEVLAATGVAITPGADFAPGHGSHHDLDGERWVRISLAGATSDMDEALTRLARWVGA